MSPMRSIVLISILTLSLPAVAQDRATTERRLESIRGQIAAAEQQIERVRSEERGALSALEGLDREIALREELVSGYRTQLGGLRRESSALRNSIQRLDGEIDQARASYRRHARNAYMRGRTSDLALILSAGSISQMIARARYLRQFTGRRQRQISRIRSKTEELRARERDLNITVSETQRLLTTSQFEQTELAERRRDREDLVRQARRRRSSLEAELAQRRADAQALESLVRELVVAEQRREEQRRQEEARRLTEQADASRRAREALQNSANNRDRQTTVPEATEPPPPVGEPLPPASDRNVSLSGSFRQNRGRLPWPANGTITGAFGTRTDPVYGTRISSPGIDISTQSGAGVNAVFEGIVERVGAMSTYGTYVMVSHSGYTTIYGNLSSVSVSQGQRVRAGQLVGRAGTSAQRRGAGLFFAVFEGESAVNPTRWLRSR